tara:strand:- start:1426 stop:1644 length:219 start_codon:yes stop_codon:yes gene_type:complete
MNKSHLLELKDDLLDGYRKDNILKEDKIITLEKKVKELGIIISKREATIKERNDKITYWEVRYSKDKTWRFW